MATVAMDRACRLLGELSEDERRQLKGRLEMLTGKATPLTSVELVYKAIATEVGKFPPWPTLMKSRKAKQFITGAEVMLQFAREEFGPFGRNEPLGRVLGLLAECVVAYARQRARGAVRPWQVIAAMADVREAVDHGYPGYQGCGVLREALIGGMRCES